MASRDYLAAFDLPVVAVSAAGRIHVTRNPAGASACWWCRAEDAARVAKAAKLTGDVTGAAAALGVKLTPHAVVMQRVTQATAKIEGALQTDAGTLQSFNSEYRRRRLAAQQAGHGFIGYGTARARLRKATARMVAGTLSTSLMAQVFEQP